MNLMFTKLEGELKATGNKKKAKVYARFFKTGQGEYGEGDVFLGITVPESREIAKKYKDLSFTDTAKLLKSKFHEARLVALLILVHNYENGNATKQKNIYEFYLRNTKYINNWDLVDLTAHKIVGAYLFSYSSVLKNIGITPGGVLERLARSKNLWEKRISIISTYWFIKHGKFDETFQISKILLNDDHDLIHKAVGWMLREVGNRDRKVEERFLKKHYKRMPRTMLRYAIEKFPENLRQKYLRGKI